MKLRQAKKMLRDVYSSARRGPYSELQLTRAIRRVSRTQAGCLLKASQYHWEEGTKKLGAMFARAWNDQVTKPISVESIEEATLLALGMKS